MKAKDLEPGMKVAVRKCGQVRMAVFVELGWEWARLSFMDRASGSITHFRKTPSKSTVAVAYPVGDGWMSDVTALGNIIGPWEEVKARDDQLLRERVQAQEDRDEARIMRRIRKLEVFDAAIKVTGIHLGLEQARQKVEDEFEDEDIVAVPLSLLQKLCARTLVPERLKVAAYYAAEALHHAMEYPANEEPLHHVAGHALRLLNAAGVDKTWKGK